MAFAVVSIVINRDYQNFIFSIIRFNSIEQLFVLVVYILF